MKITEIREKAFKLTNRIIEKVGPRLAGTKASLESADMLKDEMKEFADHVGTESFFLHKGAFLGWIKIMVVFYLLGTISIWIEYPLIAIALAVLGLAILAIQFFFYMPMIDFLYPKKEGRNVVGKIEPLGKVKKQIIVSGHHDSARVFNFFIHQPKLYNLRVTGGIAFVIILLVASILLLFIGGLFAIVIKVIVSLGFLLVGQLWFFASKKGTPGAGDNLISSSLAIQIGRHFSQNRLQNTRIIMASFDAEEEGLRGARAYAKKHKKELNEIPTFLLNVDCPYYLDEIFFMTSDINCSVDLDLELAEELVGVATEKGYKALHKPITFLTGGTDAGELAKVGVKATTLMAMPWDNSNRASVYHTPNDTIENVEVEAIDAIVDIFTTYISKKDS